MVIQPHLLCEVGDIAENVLLPGDPGRVLRMAKLLDESKEISFNREYRVVTGSYQKMPVTICSTGIGGPAAAIAIEELIKLGAKRLVRVGSCGSMQNNIAIGDIIIADSVVRNDHTATEYIPAEYPAIADPDLFQALKRSAHGYKFHAGPVMSEDALYSQKTLDMKEVWAKSGVLAQEMEAGTVLTLGRLRKVAAGVVLVVVNRSDENDIQAGIGKYAQEAKTAADSPLKTAEKDATVVALQALLSYQING